MDSNRSNRKDRSVPVQRPRTPDQLLHQCQRRLVPAPFQRQETKFQVVRDILGNAWPFLVSGPRLVFLLGAGPKASRLFRRWERLS